MNAPIKAYAELFHLLFLRLFHQEIDPKLYAIKGGCNLRFFFGSVRYSEDLDLDVQIIQKGTLQNKVEKILGGISLSRMLQSYGIERIAFSSPKQTDTTQRWKIQLHTQAMSMPIATKIETSRRDKAFQPELAAVSMELCQAYHFGPIRLSHYSLQAAIAQKVEALAYRSVTQARDVFDLYHLLHLTANEAPIVPGPETTQSAEEALQGLSFQEYQSHVISFLAEGQRIHFGDEAYWKAMIETISVYLKGQS